MSYWKHFRRNPNFLITYLLIHLLVIGAILGLQWRVLDLEAYRHPIFDWRQLALLPFGLIIGVQVPVLIHNCVHGNLRPPWLNTLMGEIAGYYVLLSLASFELNHIMHHTHSDTGLDPHNPHKKKFLGFFFANNFGGTGPVLEKYLGYHGDTRANRARFGLIVVLHFLNVPLRLLFWLLLLGPSLFAIFFVPSYLFHMFVFAHINYVTHETFEDGSAAVYNLDSNLYYRLVNYFGSGVYYHKNHHLTPAVYNPQRGASKSWLFR